MVVGCTVFLRGVLAGVGSIFGAMLGVGICKDELDVASWENWNEVEPKDGLVPSIFAESTAFLDLRSFFWGEVFVEEGGEYVCAM